MGHGVDLYKFECWLYQTYRQKKRSKWKTGQEPLEWFPSLKMPRNESSSKRYVKRRFADVGAASDVPLDFSLQSRVSSATPIAKNKNKCVKGVGVPLAQNAHACACVCVPMGVVWCGCHMLQHCFSSNHRAGQQSQKCNRRPMKSNSYKIYSMFQFGGAQVNTQFSSHGNATALLNSYDTWHCFCLASCIITYWTRQLDPKASHPKNA